jgi:plastocyanin
LCAAASVAAAQPVDVSGAVTIVRKGAPQHGKPDYSGAVVWLKPAGPADHSSHASARPQFEIRQLHKKFEPHLLAVPVGSVVSFPNLDPFFHNVFSLYDGNRFDLGLYEAGASHSVRFDRPGISFIFCNIHPEMSAVVVVVEGPYAISNAAGQVSIPSVLPGRYSLYAWHERVRKGFEGFPIEVEISRENPVLPHISLTDSGELLPPHKNKYGADYDPAPAKKTYK